MTDEQRVIAVYPNAYCYIGDGVFQILDNRPQPPKFPHVGHAIGGDMPNESLAWADAASKLPEPTPPTETRRDGLCWYGSGCPNPQTMRTFYCEMHEGKPVAAPTERVEMSPELITDEEIDAASEGGEYPKLIAWTRVLQRMRMAEAAMMTLEAAVAPSPAGESQDASKMVMLSSGEQLVWAVLNADGCECEDFVGIYATPEAAEKVAERLRFLMREEYSHLRVSNREWPGNVEVRQIAVGTSDYWRLKADGQAEVDSE